MKNICVYKKLFFLILFLSINFGSALQSQNEKTDIQKKYSQTVQKIIAAAMQDSSAWERLAYMCDTFGPRLSGSENLEKALQWIYETMKKDGLENVVKEKVMVPHWVRGNEYCRLLEPREANMPMLGLGGSIATPPEGITAPILEVENFEELKSRAAEAKGKIVLFHEPFIDYGQAVAYRSIGAIEAAKVGAVASLIRSVSPIGMQNPHTGMMHYDDTVPKIPHAAITAEDADMLHRLQERGQNPIVHLYMEAKTLPDAISYNVMGEIKGTEKPDEIIAIGGHIDSWDVGTGAHDDASGCIAAWEVIKLFKSLGLRPKRTIRAVMWVNEENGVRGGKAYAEKHKDEKHALVFEWDSGVFPPSSINFCGSDTLFNKVKEFEPYLKSISDISVKKGWCGVDISYMMKAGTPGMGFNTEDQGKYFWYHHGPSDTPDKINPKEYNQCIAAIAIAIYLYSEME